MEVSYEVRLMNETVHVNFPYPMPPLGDLNQIKIGFNSNIQDRTVIHTSKNDNPGLAPGTSIGNFVTVGHSCTLYSCSIGHCCLIGMGSVVLDGAVVEEKAILAAGTVVPPGRRIPSKQLWAGNPAKFVRDVSDDEVDQMEKQADAYHALAKTHSDEFLPYGTAYLDVRNLVLWIVMRRVHRN